MRRMLLRVGRGVVGAVIGMGWMAGLQGGAAEMGVGRDGMGRPVLGVTAAADQVVVLERAGALGEWGEWVRGHGPLEGVVDRTAVGVPGVFYRGLLRLRTGEDDWKNLVQGVGEEAFRSEEPPPWKLEARWIKFAIELDRPDRVIFQDSGRYRFHYDFAVERMPAFRGMTRAEFDAVTLRVAGQRAVLGAVLFPPTPELREVAIQLVGHDAYPREAVAEWFGTVRAAILGPENLAAFYLPTFEQAEVAREHRDWFAGQGIPVGTAGRWVTGDECYAPGWALGRMTWVPAAEIGTAYREGRLRPDDVLLTEAVPAEVPPLAGIVSLSPATPNSHVALLAKSFGIPFVHLAGEEAEEALRGWAGREVLVRAVQQFLGCEVWVWPMGSEIEAPMREAILAHKAAPRLDIEPKAARGVFHVAVDPLGPGDLRHVGGKAANFGILRQSLPGNSPSPAIAFTFDLWDAFLEQGWAGGGTLGAWVEARLGGFAWPPDMGAVQTALAEVRDGVRNRADFTPVQKQAILEALVGAGFDPMRKIRFRSSTNMEDSEQFIGAGLYDSYSGCLADDLDDDTAGPSRCDPEERAERGVFRALRRVYASFFNDNAFLERLRHGVNEADVGMAVLVHYSAPDEIERANGVATMEIRRSGALRTINGTLVTQVGAVSVSNPEGGARPEVVKVTRFSSGPPFFEVESRSSLVPLGGEVLEWTGEYEELYGLLDAASREWERVMPPQDRWILDFEYKKLAPDDRLSVNQIRPLPLPPEQGPVTFWLLNTEGRWGVEQGEFGELMALHRLKSFWEFETRHTRWDEASLGETLFDRVEGRWIEGLEERTLAGPIATLPGYRYGLGEEATEDAWESDWATWRLRVHRGIHVPNGAGPVAVLQDARVEWEARYASPQPTLEVRSDGVIANTTTSRESVNLVPLTPVGPGSKRQERMGRKGGWEVRTEFYWPPEPKGIVAGYTAPLQAWVETTVTGFTSRPVVLRGDFSQTYRPGHHNFWEEFLFDPWLEPGLEPDLLAELAAADIRGWRLVWDGPDVSQWSVLGMDGRFRELR
ncbi:MAG: hypothetical protein KF833_22435 [Verrucomicrobiae bacterium]|nr:hypothetical protein [Verrucomicrobiae bacterium]